MSLIVKEPDKPEPIDEGVFHGICFMVIELGTHLNETFGKYNQQIAIGWELPELRFDESNLPRSITKIYTHSLHKKAQLRQDLTSWRGRNFTAEELAGFDLSKVISANCMLQIIHKESGDKTYANISSILPLMKGYTEKTPENKIITYDINKNGLEIPEIVPEWLRNIIIKSQEYQMMIKAKNSDDLSDSQRRLNRGKLNEEEIINDCPF